MATVIFKPTEACNASCIYCSVPKDRHGPAVMPLDTLEIFFSRVNEFLLERPQEPLQIVWHGGEPLTLGPDYFARALYFQEKHCSQTNRRIRHHIQSNLTLFSREFADILRKLGVASVGTSYEPLENLRGLGRKRDSREYNRRFMDAIGLAADEGFGWGVIYVVTRLSLAKPLEIFQFFANLSPPEGFMFNPILLHGPELEHLKITPEEYADFLGSIFPVWWEYRQEFPKVDPFASLAANLLEGSRTLICRDSGACADTHFSVLPDGSLSLCGRSGDWGLLNFGSIWEKSFAQVLAHPQRDLLRQRHTVLPAADCRGCRFWSVCHGGCPLEAWFAAKSFLHKSDWCPAKKGFIEKYFEPTVNPGSTGAGKPESLPPSPQPDQKLDTGGSKTAPGQEARRGPAWINPHGGLGDALLLSGVLKQVVEQDPSRKFNLVARAKFGPLLTGHPGLADLGHPPPGARVISTDYWTRKDFQPPGERAYQALARSFGLKTPVEERLFIPGELEDDPVLLGLIPWKPHNVLICPGADSPKKQMASEQWEALVELLHQDGTGVVQAGNLKDRYIRGAYSLLGLTTPRQLMAMLRHFEAVVTGDNFVMHAAHLCGVPAVVLWGPTEHRVHGYSGQIHLQAAIDCEFKGGCLRGGDLEQRDCPQGPGHCLKALKPEAIYLAVKSLLKNKEPHAT